MRPSFVAITFMVIVAMVMSSWNALPTWNFGPTRIGAVEGKLMRQMH